ncbi:MAG: EutN/CcmL family microcompartment protein [Clostridia bacterium]|jgi:ethanolamine utilization protein EutN|nr:EutN/CcmL family microcompartment protein [Clostridia bacterium]
MQLGKIVGTVVATRKDDRLVGSKLMITQPLTAALEPRGDTLIAVDTVGAGVGEIVLYIVGSVAPFAVRKDDAPVDAAIVGIIDSVEYREGNG